MILFGGRDSTYTVLSDIWELDLGRMSKWKQWHVPGEGPVPRFLHSAVYRGATQSMVVFGGGSEYWSSLNDVWELPLTRGKKWVRLAESNLSRMGHVAVYDERFDRMYVHDGAPGDGHAWMLDVAADSPWQRIEAGGALLPWRSGHAGILDPIRRRLVVHGGWGGSFCYASAIALSLDEPRLWERAFPKSEQPEDVRHPAVAYDFSQRRLFAFGGYRSGYLDEFWTLGIDNLPLLERGPIGGSRPTPRVVAAATWDSRRNQMIMFGGEFCAEGTCVRPQDVWCYSPANAIWSMCSPSGTRPPGRYGHRMVYDSLFDRVIMYGPDLWVHYLGPQFWVNRSSSVSPPARTFHSMMLDPKRRRVIVFGGNNGGGLNDVWALALETLTWERILPLGREPSPRWLHTAVYDSKRDRMVVFGGGDFSGPGDECWALSLGGVLAWEELRFSDDFPRAWRNHAAVYDEVYDRMLIWRTDGESPGLWELLFADAAPRMRNLTAERPDHGEASDVTLSVTNPVSPAGLRLRLSAPAGERVTVELADITGRCLRSVDVVGQGATAFPVSLDGGQRLRPGVYLVRARDGRAAVTRKVVVAGK